ncbi:glycosyltransferase family 2 protein [Rhodopseudomonas palustris]|uniref:glycosyltransferase family 2 protein n=1 Tax=Rhodopseudomonas palustris TaxID=1076 RepID=UPI0022F05B06|nr:glycosyltransferase family 2 protein [Rhodopseudomonas palustris]WBU31255.1 glycosyltransferase family 2 protein [Rhodopseudomonas palustris]
MASEILFSIVTPTYNRHQTIRRSIDASLAFANLIDPSEVVIVDDASTDGTSELLSTQYASQIQSGKLQILTLKENKGVTGARNAGCHAARGKWLIFVDSDDELLSGSASLLSVFVGSHSVAPLLFFRCELEDGTLIGHAAPPGPLDLDTMVNFGTPGECLPVVQRAAIEAFPFDEDLRGWEGLAYLRIVRAYGPAILSDTVARRYGTTSTNRLSTFRARAARAKLLARGFRKLLVEFGGFMSMRRRSSATVRIIFYYALSLLYRC